MSKRVLFKCLFSNPSVESKKDPQSIKFRVESYTVIMNILVQLSPLNQAVAVINFSHYVPFFYQGSVKVKS
ncbi:hypothetical protein [Bacillus sp. AFS088145]|uniref:hypothetical protein n=1 Tax=Bacillus sp. AFS088145 TaxID=2033514 RepID=UPI000BF6CCA8|nr:hypothetical protein [Bacillus sp. AFS088145]PFH83679.1 hypothetical protein COI44_17895 [Bacillus sp. AFS088145]